MPRELSRSRLTATHTVAVAWFSSMNSCSDKHGSPEHSLKAPHLLDTSGSAFWGRVRHVQSACLVGIGGVHPSTVLVVAVLLSP